MSLEADRAALRERWYQDGFYGRSTAAELFREGAERFSASTMHFVGGVNPCTVTLGELHSQSLRVAGGLAELGVGPGSRVAVWVPNWVEGALAYQAVAMLGATIVPIIHIYGSTEVGFILRQSRADVLVMPRRWRSIDYRERFEAVSDIPDLRHVVSIGDDGPVGAVTWERIAASSPLEDHRGSDPDDVCLLIYTSGTTAEPKGVQHTTNTLVAEIRSTAAALGQSGGVGLAAFPAGHIAGVLGLLRIFLMGGSTVLMDAWDAELAARLVHEHRVESTAGAPFFLSTMFDAAASNGYDLSSIRHYMVGAASVPAALVERADAVGIPVYRGYGSSEHPVISTGVPSDPVAKRAGTDGRLTPGNEVRLLDDDDREVPLGADGEIVSRGPELFVGYSNPALDVDAILPGGWFRTGDIGRIDDDGYLTITDRKKDVIIRGGENLSSKEIEDILATHPAVAEAAAVGAPDDRYGERVAVFVQLRPGTEMSLDEVRAHFASSGVAKQKTPERLELVDELPRSMSGKVRKVELRAQLRGDARKPS
ncbi:MAG: AMP-binding protein [Ilumatobacteraceae bacterium]